MERQRERKRKRERGGAGKCWAAWMSSFPPALWKNLLGIQKCPSQLLGMRLPKTAKVMLDGRFSVYAFFFFYPKCTSATFGCVR